MAGRRLLIAIVVMAAVLTAAAFQYRSFRAVAARQASFDDRRFINTYVDLSASKGDFAGRNPDSLAAVFDSLLAQNETDSLWMRQYLNKIGPDLERYRRVWQEIVDSLSVVNERPGD